jgi:fibronectin type 3 domain-containing protein
MVFLQWTELDDPRIAGYRAYRATDDGDPVPVGSTFVPGFVDLTAELDHTYHYTVVSFTEDGIESQSSNVVDVTLEPWRSYLLLIRRGFR